MKSKKGIAWSIVKILLAICILIIGCIIIVAISSGSRDAAVDTACRIGCIWRSLATAKGPVTGHEYTFAPEFCERRGEEIQPDNWKECPGFKEIYDTEVNGKYPRASEAVNKCAAQQVLDLARRCWSMRGKGVLDCGDIACFSACMNVPSADALSRNVRFTGVNRGMLQNIADTVKVPGTDHLYIIDVPIDLLSFSSTIAPHNEFMVNFDEEDYRGDSDSLYLNTLPGKC